MRGAVSYSAELDSIDRFVDGIGGRDRLPTRLTIRFRGKKLDTFIENPNLQFICTSFVGTFVTFKFDNGKPERFRCTQESTDQFGVAFIVNANRLAPKIRAAHEFWIEADVFQRGQQQMHFVNPGLEWGNITGTSP